MTPEAEPTASPPARLLDWVTLLRPQQWYKNLILYAGVIFSVNFLQIEALARVTLGFAIFCLAAGGVYALNDAYDAKADRNHPAKVKRPIASGRVSMPAGVAFGLVCATGALVLAWWFQAAFGLTVSAYLLLQALYIPVLKHHVFLDLFSIALGLILRAIAGVVLVAVFLSPWLLLCTFFLALFLGLGKRRSEVRTLGASAALHRPSLTQYSEPLLNQSLNVVMAAIVLSYSMYTFSHPNQWMMVTIPFVLYGMFRYLFLEIEKGIGGEPEAIFRDAPSVINLGLWVLVVGAVLYTGPQRLMELWQGLV